MPATVEVMNRESWLTAFAEKLVKPLEQITSKAMPNFRISCSFPSRGGLAVSKRTIGQCWDKVVSKTDGTHQLFISPLLGDEMEVAATIAHELAHCIVGTKYGHRAVFGRAVRPLGLLGKLTATVAGPVFIEQATPILSHLGKYPHGGMVINSAYKRDTCRLLKVQCPKCQYKARITATWVNNDAYGPPLCPLHNIPMQID